jgi:DNA-binding response OmpR family regulator
VLVADDDPQMRDLYATLLGDAGHRVTLVGDGAAALRALSERPDVIVLDLAMPMLDGYEFIGRMRTAGSMVPVLVVSARIDAARLAGKETLAKPFDCEELLARLSGLLAPAKGA